MIDLGLKLCDAIANGSPPPAVPKFVDPPKHTPQFSGRLNVTSELISRINYTAVDGTGFFSEPQKLCSLLDAQGFKSEGWRFSKMPEAYCETNSPLDLDHEGLLTRNRLEYEVDGYRHRAQRIALGLNIWNDKWKASAKTLYMQAVSLLFARLAQPVPAGLVAAIKAEQQFRTEEAYGTVSLNVHQNSRPFDPARDDSLYRGSLDLEIRDSRAATIARDTFKALFEACQSEVLRNFGMAKESIAGDALPRFIEDYTFFAIEWRKHTIAGRGAKLYDSDILCSVHPDGSYALDQGMSFREHSAEK